MITVSLQALVPAAVVSPMVVVGVEEVVVVAGCILALEVVAGAPPVVSGNGR